MILKMKDISTTLGSRVLGRQIRDSITSKFDTTNQVILDFEGVDVVSNSFADECFAKMLLTHDMDFIKSKTTFKNTNGFVKKTISFAFKQRIGEKIQQQQNG